MRERPVNHWRTVFPEILIAAAVAVLGVFEASGSDNLGPDVVVALSTALAVGVSRRLPSLGLALVWMTCTVQILQGSQLMMVQVCLVAVGFGTARWGTSVTLWLSGLSVPAAVAIFLSVAVFFPFRWGINLQPLLQLADEYGARRPVVALVAMAVLGVPWLAGLTLRFVAKARRSQAAMVQAEEDTARARREVMQIREISRLREEQTRLARDVHDVVGHSLAVILAQAESGQYLDDDPQRLKQTMATIATSARSSLQDVREVLSATRDDLPPAGPAELEHLIAGIRASGLDVTLTEIGAPRPLPAELEVVAFRVLQEMLTNAIRHGRRDRPIRVERNWPDESTDDTLRLVVANDALSSEPSASGGLGLEGMRHRLEAANGQIETRYEHRGEGTVFIATARIPIGAAG
jgi:signal transduction histidine kinase